MPRNGAVVKNQADGSGVGDVRYSMLTEAEFQAQNGTTWVLMDGRNVAGSRYAAIKAVSTIPDHRGQSPRMKNNGRADGNQDPDGERALGSIQGYKTATTTLGINDPGHSHTTSMGDVNFAHFGRSGPAFGDGGVFNGLAFGALHNTETKSAGTSLTGGANETTMRNLALNAFIKIN